MPDDREIDIPSAPEPPQRPSERSGRLPPQDIEAERFVLGAVLLENKLLSEVMSVLTDADFYREGHRKIFAAMCDLDSRNEPLDIKTVGNELLKRGELNAEGAAYLSAIDSDVPSSANVAQYAQIVREKSVGRRLVEAAHQIAREAYEERGELRERLDSAERRILAVVEQSRSKSKGGPVRVGELLPDVFNELEIRFERKSGITGITTGLESLDAPLAGMQRGDLIIVAGRPSMGKTSVAIQIAEHVAAVENMPVVIFELEMRDKDVIESLLSSQGRVDGQIIRTGQLSERDWPKLARAGERLHKASLFIDDDSNVTMQDIRSRARRIVSKCSAKLGLVVIDYLGLVIAPGHVENREQQVSEMSRTAKAMAKEFDCPVILLSQLNRKLEERKDKRPMQSDLRESGAIEQDADVILFVYRDEVYNKDSKDKGIAEIIIAKQRKGPLATVRTAFLKDIRRFENLDENDRPTREAKWNE